MLEQQERFMQEWLFFGLLHELYQDFSISDKDFISSSSEGRQILDTTSLNTLARQWIGKYTPFERLIYGLHLRKCLDVISEVLSRMNVTDFGGVNSLIVWSVFIVYQHVEDLIFFQTNMAPTAALLSQHLGGASAYTMTTLGDICSTQVSHLRRELTPVGLYYVSQLGRCSTHANDLRTCGEYVCTRNTIPPGAYETKHWEECDGTCLQLEVDQDRLCTLLEEGTVPGVLLEESLGDGGLELKIVPCSAEHPYVAISHIWSDGLGNEKANALPKCQVRRLFRLITEMHENFNTPTALWIDTLCCPVTSDKGRDSAIAFMRRTYQDASATLVLDASLENVPIAELDDIEVLMHIALCPWKSRLWTLQEGKLPPVIYFHFKDNYYNWVQGSSRLEQLAEPWRIPIFYYLQGSVRSVRGDPALADPDSPPPGEVAGPGEVVGPEEFDSFSSGTWISSEIELNPFSGLAQALKRRATSYAGDEAICLATLLRFPESCVRQISRIPRSDVSGRMKEFWTLMGSGHIPPHIILNGARRLDIKGFRWAPQSFLHVDAYMETIWKSPPTARLSESGLLVTLRGFVLTVPALHEDTLEIHDKFVFRAQQGNWFSVTVTIAPHSRPWMSGLRATSLALILKDGIEAEIPTADVGAEFQGFAVVAVRCDDPDTSPNTTELPAGLSTGPSESASKASPAAAKPPIKVLSIGHAHVERIDPHLAAGFVLVVLNFMHAWREKPRSEILARLDSLIHSPLWNPPEGQERESERILKSFFHKFHNIQGEFIGDASWCFV
jgi:hypothetical protein